MAPLRVLITNIVLCGRSGTETYSRDLALELRRRGHTPVVYSPDPGVVGDELLAAGVRVVSHLNGEPVPDVIHGHHHVEAMTAVLRFPGAPAVYVRHGADSWHDRTPIHPRIHAYVAVDENCRDRFPADGVERERVLVIPNGVDLERFRPRGPLPDRPRRALLFSHNAAESTHLPVVREACRRAGLELDVIGLASGNSCAKPEELLGRCDIVFGKARCALEAMAVGCAVVLCDHLGAGPLVHSDRWAELRPLNFGRRTCTALLTPEALLAEVERYDPVDAAKVCRLTRASAGVEATTDALLAVYAEVIRAQAAAEPDSAAEAHAVAEYLRTRLAKPQILRVAQDELQQSWTATAIARQKQAEQTTLAEAAQRELAESRAEAIRVRQELAESQAAAATVERELTQLRAEYAHVSATLEIVAHWRSRWKARGRRLWSRIRRTCSPWRACSSAGGPTS